MKEMPLVSVILCVYNGDSYLREAIESVLAQDYTNLEFIAVDDGSTDGTTNILAEFPSIRAISNPENLGISEARNRGIEKASGQFITFIDADDLWVDNKITRQVEYHLNHPDIDYSFIMERFFYTKETEKPSCSKKQAAHDDHIAYGTSGAFTKREVYEKVGGYSSEFSGMESGEWQFRAKDMGFKGGTIEEVLLFRRIHENNTSREVNKNLNLLFRNLKSSIDRQKDEK